MKFYILCFCLSVLTNYATCANILAIFHSPVYSENELFKTAKMTGIEKLRLNNHYSTLFTESFMRNPSFKKLLNPNTKFDVIIYERFMNEALLGLSHHFQAPYIWLGILGHCRWLNDVTRNPASPAYTPDIFLHYSSNMNFWQRSYNTFFEILSQIRNHFYVFPKHQKLLEEFFPGAPSLEELYHNASLVFVNTHPAVKYSAPLVPNMIEIGGYHISPVKRLPEGIQTFLDSAKNGFIYFSLGSGTKSKDVSKEVKNSVVRTFGNLKEKIIWKYEEGPTFNVPANVKLGKWFPQQDILAHQNVKLFITHGGLLSTIEAIHFGVPLLVIPIFAEQRMNAAEAEEYGYGLQLPYKDFSEEKFESLIQQQLTNKKYRENAKSRSKALHDQQTFPIDRAIFWTEYVIRNKGAPYLKPITLKLKWYQNHLLDVLALGAAIVFIICFVLVSLLLNICRRKIEGSANAKEKKTK